VVYVCHAKQSSNYYHCAEGQQQTNTKYMKWFNYNRYTTISERLDQHIVAKQTHASNILLKRNHELHILPQHCIKKLCVSRSKILLHRFYLNLA